MGNDAYASNSVVLETASICELPYDRLEEMCHSLSGLNHQLMRLASMKITTDKRLQMLLAKSTADEKLAFVALGPSNHVAVVNAETYEVEDYILVGRRVWHMDFSPDKSLLFTTNGVSGDVTVIDVASLKPIKTIKVGRFPWGAAARP